MLEILTNFVPFQKFNVVGMVNVRKEWNVWLGTADWRVRRESNLSKFYFFVFFLNIFIYEVIKSVRKKKSASTMFVTRFAVKTASVVLVKFVMGEFAWMAVDQILIVLQT